MHLGRTRLRLRSSFPDSCLEVKAIFKEEGLSQGQHKSLIFFSIVVGSSDWGRRAQLSSGRVSEGNGVNGGQGKHERRTSANKKPTVACAAALTNFPQLCERFQSCYRQSKDK